jgi:multidrug transporter EmrE-like cation transporter
MKTKLGIIRTFMAGFETIILFGVGYMIFNEKIDTSQLIGVISILLGIYLIGNK